MEEFFHEKEAMYQLPMQRIPDWGHYTFHFKLKKKNTKETTILFAECRWLLQGWIIDWRSNIEPSTGSDCNHLMLELATG